MNDKPTLRAYRLMQVALVVVTLAMLFSLYVGYGTLLNYNQQLRLAEEQLVSLERLLGDVRQTREHAQEIVTRAEKTLATAEARIAAEPPQSNPQPPSQTPSGDNP